MPPTCTTRRATTPSSATSSYAYLSGSGFSNEAVGFRSVSAYSTGGGDQAYLYGTMTSADTFVQSGSLASLYGNAFLDLATLRLRLRQPQRTTLARPDTGHPSSAKKLADPTSSGAMSHCLAERVSCLTE